MQRRYRAVLTFVFSILFIASLTSPTEAESPALNEGGIPSTARERYEPPGENPIKATNPQEGEISLFYVGSALWQATLTVCGDGDYAYAYENLGLQVIDFSNPASPQVIGQCHQQASVADMIYNGGFVYVAAGYHRGLMIFDVSDPYSPVLASSVESYGNLTFDGYGVEFVNDTVFLSGGRNIVILDVSDPYSPQVLGIFGPAGYAYNATVLGSYLYTASQSFIECWDITEIPAPVYLEPIYCGEDVRDVISSGSLLYVASDYDGLHIVDVSGEEPSQVALFPDMTEHWRGIGLAGEYVYLQSFGKMDIIDVHTPSAPTLADSWMTGGMTYDMYLSADNLYLADWYNGVARYDISSQAAPVLDAEFTTPGMGFDLAVSGNYGYEANGEKGLQVLDLADPASPAVVDNYDTPGEAVAVASVGNALYLSDDAAGLMIFDITDPGTPLYFETLDLSEVVRDIIIENGYAYMVGGDTLLVFDVIDPLNPVRTSGTYVTTAKHLAIRGNYAYVSTETMGLRIVDISDPASPVLGGSCSVSGPGFAVAVVGDYAYFSHDYYRYMSVVDISDPDNPNVVADFTLPQLSAMTAWVHNMQLVGDYLYMAADNAGFLVYNVGNPLSPVLVEVYNTNPAWAWDLEVAGDYIYVTCDNGFLVLGQAVCTGPDGADGYNIADAVYLIRYIFSGGPAPDPVQSGDVNCDGAIDVGDAVYLIDFIFRNGQPPCGGCF